MAKGQMRTTKEKKKPKATRTSPSNCHPISWRRCRAPPAAPTACRPAKRPDNQRRPTVPDFDFAGNSLACLAISRQVNNST